MEKYVTQALFIHTPETAHHIDRLRVHESRATITPILANELLGDGRSLLSDTEHVVVSGPLDTIKAVMKLAMEFEFSVGILPTENQKNLTLFYNLPKNINDVVDLALRADPMTMDLVLCNDHIVLFKATVGNIPLLDSASDADRLRLLWTAIRRFFALTLMKYKFSTPDGRQIVTAASGCMILHHHKGSMAARMIAGDSCVADGLVSTVVSAPKSVVEYIKFLIRILSQKTDKRSLPSGIGYLKVPAVDIEPESEADVFIDGEKLSRTPLHCEAKPAAIKINVGKDVEDDCTFADEATERIEVNNLPRGKELIKVQRRKTIPFFSYASEERFRDLFSDLREDAEINSLYLVLMVLSTMLAAAGLYLNSATVIIGAMLLAPLMAPIVSLAMGLLRGEEAMAKKSSVKIIIGIAIALSASTAITLLFPHKPVTGEMQARLNPTLLDMAVAIISGIAAAYSKSHKEIIQSLAGVAIAVALVPPLAVAGTGIGWGDFQFFSQAFLLFLTNLIGIIIAAAVTFRVLGFSPAIHSKRSIGLVVLLLMLISVPLYASYNQIVEDRILEKAWQKERFLVNDKYVIIDNAHVQRRGEKKIIVMDVVVREVLNRSDLKELKKRVHTYFSGELVIRAKTVYIP